MWIMKNNLQIFLISTQKLYFVDNDAIFDIIRDMKSAGIHLLNYQTYSTIWIFRQIDSAYSAIRGLSYLHKES